jgi:hypothetical protein
LNIPGSETPNYHGGTDRKVLRAKMANTIDKSPHLAKDLFAAGAATGHWGGAPGR